MQPVRGKVTVNGKAVEGVYLQFHNVADATQPPDGCQSEADGTFVVSLHASGEFAVTTFWPAVTVHDGERIEGVDRLNDRYRDPLKPVTKIQIQPGDSTMPDIALKRN